MSEVQGSLIELAYSNAETVLRAAVDNAKSPAQFQKNLQQLQLTCQRVLAVMIFNSHLQNKISVDELLEQVGLGLKRELNDLSEAAKDERNLTSVTAEFAGENAEH